MLGRSTVVVMFLKVLNIRLALIQVSQFCYLMSRKNKVKGKFMIFEAIDSLRFRLNKNVTILSLKKVDLKDKKRLRELLL